MLKFLKQQTLVASVASKNMHLSAFLCASQTHSANLVSNAFLQLQLNASNLVVINDNKKSPFQSLISGLPKIAAKVEPDSCKARFDSQGNCGVSEDNCDPGSVAVPSKISLPPPLPAICVCSCEPEQAGGEAPVKIE